MSKTTIPSIEELLEAGVHFGHTTSRWHPKMKPFLFGKKGGAHIIDLARTREKLEQAVEFVRDQASSGKNILFVGVKPLARSIVQEEALRAETPFMVNRWIGGTLTNWKAIAGMIKRMKQLEDDKASGKLAKYTKREQLIFAEEYGKLSNEVGGLRTLSKTPDALFVVDAKYDKTAIAEARTLGKPIVAITDSNINPTKVQYPIPANDDALKSIALITRVIADAIIEGRERAATVSEKEAN